MQTFQRSNNLLSFFSFISPVLWFSALLFAVFGLRSVLEAQSNYATPYIFSTLAGQASSGNSDGLGSAARFNGPNSVAADGAGNVYVADRANHTIRKITSAGAVTTLAGSTGNSGSSDGTGTAARFNSPFGLTVDDAGNVYVADTLNSKIRKITPAGVVTTLAGSAAQGSADGMGAVAQFIFPYGVAVDGAGNVYVADTFNSTIRKITPAGVVSTLAGTAQMTGSMDATGSAARFNSPRGLTVDQAGNVYVADRSNQTIRKITSAGVVTTLAGTALAEGATDGMGSTARFSYPSGVAVDGAGNIYVADTENYTIRKITSAGVVTTIAGAFGGGSTDGTGTAARFVQPGGVTVDSAGNIFVADSGNNTIRKITPASVVTTVAGTADSRGSTDGTGTAARFNYPQGDMAVDSSGNIYVADTENCTIRKITSLGVVTTFAGTALSHGTTDGQGSAARFDNPNGVAIDGSDNLYVTDSGNNTIRKITPNGVVTTFAGTARASGSTDGVGTAATFSAPAGIAVDGAGNVYVADFGNTTIRKITAAGVVTTFAGTAFNFGSTDGMGSTARFVYPTGIAVDYAGNVYVSDTGNNSIRKITPAGDVTTVAGNPPFRGATDGTGSASLFNSPHGIAVDDAGNLYVADTGNAVIRKITSAGSVTTLGGLVDSFGSTDGLGSVARFNYPLGMAVDGVGNIYVVDTNSTIRKGILPPVPVLVAQPPSLTIASGYSVTLSVTANDTTALSFQWQKDGVNVIGATGNSYTISSVSPADAGNYRVMVSNSSGTTTSNTAVLTVVLPFSGSIAAPSDFNTDGKSDLLWQNTDTGQRSIWLMNGTTLTAGVSLGLSPTQWSIAAVADFNADGKPDLLWQNTLTGERTFWLMNGSTFGSSVDLGTYSTDLMIAGAGDFNGDGKPDLVWQNTSTGERSIWLMNGTTLGSMIDLGTFPPEWSIAGTGEFNGDGKCDLIWQNTVTGERAIWLMNGTTVTAGVALGVYPQLQISGTGDYNGDGKSDILWTNVNTGERIIWLMNGTTKASEVSLGVVSLDWVLNRPVFRRALADFNNDGKSDLVWQNTAAGDRAIWIMNGIEARTGLSLGNYAVDQWIAAVGDFNNDGKADLVWENRTTGARSIALMNGTTVLSTVGLGTYDTAWKINTTGDFNADGKPDLVWTNSPTGARAIWLMDGTAFTAGVDLGTVAVAQQIAGTGDFDGDGKTDILWQNTTTGARTIWLMNGTTHTSTATLGTYAPEWSIVGTGDYNADGKPDLLWQNTNTGERAIWLMDGTTFLTSSTIGTYDTHWSIRN